MIPGITSGNAVTASGGGSGTGWSPSLKSGSVVLTDGVRTATFPGGSSLSVLDAISAGKTSGKRYAEFLVQTLAVIVRIGVNNGTSVPSNLGDAAAGRSYGSTGSGSGLRYGSGSQSNWGGAFVSGDVVGVAADIDAGLLWFSRNGVWQVSGDPAAGTNAAFSSVPSSSGLRIGATSRSGSVLTVRLTSGFGYSPPAGFVAWDS